MSVLLLRKAVFGSAGRVTRGKQIDGRYRRAGCRGDIIVSRLTLLRGPSVANAIADHITVLEDSIRCKSRLGPSSHAN